MPTPQTKCKRDKHHSVRLIAVERFTSIEAS